MLYDICWVVIDIFLIIQQLITDVTTLDNGLDADADDDCD